MAVKKIDNINLRSDDVQEILGHIPHWLIRWGITVIFSTVFVLLIGSWFFKYPDIITSTIVITSENPPAVITAKTDGKIQQLFVKDNQYVSANEYLAVIENPADYEAVRKIKFKLEFLSISDTFENKSVMFSENYSLGEIQSVYATFVKCYKDYQYFMEQKYYTKRIQSIKTQIAKYYLYYDKLSRQSGIMEKELNISNKQYIRDSLLFEQKAISKADFEMSESRLFQQKFAFEGAKSNMASAMIQITELEQSILDMSLQYEQEINKYILSLKEALENLKSQVDIWEQKYVLKSPISGIVTFTKFWSENQNVKFGENVITVVSDGPNVIIGRVKLPIQGSGKVKPGQRVNIKFDNYPYIEYGMIKGTVNSKSLVAEENMYSLEVSLPKELVTNYGKKIEFSHEMQGTAEILTDDIRLIQRLFNPFKALVKKHTD